MNQKLKIRADFASYQCGGRYIPSKFKYWTDEKGNKLKTPRTFKQYSRKRADTYKAAKSGIAPQTEYEKKLLADIRDRKTKIDKKQQQLKLKRAAKSVGTTTILSSGIAEADVDKLKVDPKRFQYKILGEHTKSGSVGSLTGVKKWDPNLAGIVQVWNDPKDGNSYVVNGHNRADLAKKLGVEKVTVKFIKADTPKEARAVGALTNIAEGRGNAQDAAKFFRDSGLKKEDLDKKGIPMREKIATDGIAMSQLSDNLFNRVVQGTLPEQRAVAIGGKLTDHKQQQELLDLVEKEEKKGKRITNDTINELTDMVVDAPKVESSQGGLLGMLGFAPESRSLAIEKAQLQSSIKKQLTREKKLFGTVGKSRAASELKKAGNQINVEESAEISDTASKALDAFDKEKNLSGSVSNSINRGAGRIAAGESAKSVEREIYQEVLDELQKTYRFGKRESSRGVKRRIGGEREMAASRYQTQKAEFGELFVRKSKNGRLHQVRSRKKKPDTKNILLTAGGLALGGSLIGLGAGNLLGRSMAPKIPKGKYDLSTGAGYLEAVDPQLLKRLQSTPFSRFNNLAKFNEAGTYQRRTKTGKIAIVKKGRRAQGKASRNDELKKQNNLLKIGLGVSAGTHLLRSGIDILGEGRRFQAHDDAIGLLYSRIGKNLTPRQAIEISKRII